MTQDPEHDCPDACGMEPLVHVAAASITEQLARAFDTVWHRPDAAVLVEGFLDGGVSFVVKRTGVVVVSHDPAATQ